MISTARFDVTPITMCDDAELTQAMSFTCAPQAHAHVTPRRN